MGYNGLKTAFDIVSMQKLVCLVAVGLAQEVLIQCLDDGVLVRLAEIHILISIVKNCSTLRLQIHTVADGSRLIGLATAVYAAAGASHDFNEINLVGAVLYAAKQLAGVSRAAGNSNVQFHVTQLVAGGKLLGI